MPPKLVLPPGHAYQDVSALLLESASSSWKGGKGKDWGGKGHHGWKNTEAALLSMVPVGPIDLSSAVENFLRDNGIDEEASSALRMEEEDIQRQVIIMEMTGAKNPSYTLLSHILKAKNQTPAKLPPILCEKFAIGQCALAADQCYFSHDEELLKQKKFERLAIVYGCSIEEAVQICQKGKTSMCKNFKTGSCNWGARCAFAHSQEELPEGRAEVESFIRDHSLEGNVAKFLLSQNLEVQKMVMAKGGVEGPVEHKSTQFMGRIRDAVWAFENGVTGPAPEEVEIFIAESKLDEKAAAMMRTVGAPIQADVMGQGALPMAQNPSAACVKRIQDAKKRFRDQMKYGITSPAPVVHSPAAPGLGVASNSVTAALAPAIAQSAQLANVALALQGLQNLQAVQSLAALQQQQQQQQQPAVSYQTQASPMVGMQQPVNPLAAFSIPGATLTQEQLAQWAAVAAAQAAVAPAATAQTGVTPAIADQTGVTPAPATQAGVIPDVRFQPY